MTFLLIFVTLNFADVAVNIQRGKKTVEGTLSKYKWKDFDESFLAFYVNSNNGINDVLFTILTSINVNVRGLVIKHNKFIEYLPEKVNENFQNVIAYDAWNCSVKSISTENFRNMRKLEGLYLPYNQIEFIDERVFDDLVSLKILRLDYNKIYYVAKIAFKNLKNLNELHLQFNELKSFYFDLELNTELSKLSISDNNISILVENHFDNNKKLEFMWLNNNKILYINSILFDGLNNLKYVDLKNNTCINSHYHTSALVTLKNNIENDC